MHRATARPLPAAHIVSRNQLFRTWATHGPITHVIHTNSSLCTNDFESTRAIQISKIRNGSFSSHQSLTIFGGCVSKRFFPFLPLWHTDLGRFNYFGVRDTTGDTLHIAINTDRPLQGTNYMGYEAIFIRLVPNNFVCKISMCTPPNIFSGYSLWHMLNINFQNQIHNKNSLTMVVY